MYYNIKESGERIRQLRIENGYTQEEVAEAINIDRSFFSRIESGKKGCSVDLLIHFSQFFCVSMDYLVLGKEFGDIPSSAGKARLKKDITALLVSLEHFKSTL